MMKNYKLDGAGLSVLVYPVLVYSAKTIMKYTVYLIK